MYNDMLAAVSFLLYIALHFLQLLILYKILCINFSRKRKIYRNKLNLSAFKFGDSTAKITSTFCIFVFSV